MSQLLRVVLSAKTSQSLALHAAASGSSRSKHIFSFVVFLNPDSRWKGQFQELRNVAFAHLFSQNRPG